MNKLSRAWKIGIAASLVAGLLLRFLYLDDMEFKEDEEIAFNQSQKNILEWVGMPTGVYIYNPGMSLWIFQALAKVFRATTPTGLMVAAQIFTVIGICMIPLFALRFISDAREREPWLWAFVLALVNPIAIFYQRKLWPFASQLPFCMLIFISWWQRSNWGWAFLWGFAGAWLGQIHMSGFFMAGGLALWTLVFERKLPKSLGRTHWKGWFAGSVLGALPLIPWAWIVLHQKVHHAMVGGWNNRLELKFWVFWLTNPFGLHLGNPIGLLRGNAHWQQLSDFVRYPIVGGSPTYLVGAAHLVLLAATIWILGSGVLQIKKAGFRKTFITGDRTAFLIGAGFFGMGLLLTATAVNIRRYYLFVSFPLEFVLLARFALQAVQSKWLTPKRVLVSLWVAQLVVSAAFVGYIHLNEGATQGDYGLAFHRIMSERQKK